MRLVARLQDFGDLLCLVVRPYGETVRPTFTTWFKRVRVRVGWSTCAGLLSVIVSQYRKLLSSCMVRAQAQCLLSRVGVISPQARETGKRRCREGGEGAQRGAECAVDGVPEGARVGKEVQMPYGALNIEIIVL